MTITERLFKPEYLFRPSQLLRRLARPKFRRPEVAEVSTPWGLPMQVRPHETVGHSLWHLGVLDLPVSEVIARLIEPGETAVDVGANIGYVTGLMATRLGPAGEVWSFEPHPGLFAELQAHARRWDEMRSDLAAFHLHPTALSSRAGESVLFEPTDFEGNCGTATLEAVSAETGRPNDGRQWRIQTEALDCVLPVDRAVGVLKVDVEGHELGVFEGAAERLRAGRVRDIVFEEHHGYPSPATRLLEAAGYRLFLITRSVLGPELVAPDAAARQLRWLPPNFLATRDQERALRLCRPRGWRVL